MMKMLIVEGDSEHYFDNGNLCRISSEASNRSCGHSDYRRGTGWVLTVQRTAYHIESRTFQCLRNCDGFLTFPKLCY